MGYVLSDDELGPDAGEYSGEVRRESFYLQGEANFCRIGDAPCPNGCTVDGEHTHGAYDYEKKRHGIFVYGNESGQGTVEILIEDIPKIRAVLDAVEAHVQKGNK
jgi:hypothetical protein